MMMTDEVIPRQWEAIMGNNQSDFKGEDLLVETASYKDIHAFIARLNLFLEEQGLAGFRLPNEKEWEYAAMAWTTDYHEYWLGFRLVRDI